MTYRGQEVNEVAELSFLAALEAAQTTEAMDAARIGAVPPGTQYLVDGWISLGYRIGQVRIATLSPSEITLSEPRIEETSAQAAIRFGRNVWQGMVGCRPLDTSLFAEAKRKVVTKPLSEDVIGVVSPITNKPDPEANRLMTGHPYDSYSTSFARFATDQSQVLSVMESCARGMGLDETGVANYVADAKAMLEAQALRRQGKVTFWQAMGELVRPSNGSGIPWA